MTRRTLRSRLRAIAALAVMPLLTAGLASAQVPTLVDTIEAPEPGIPDGFFGFTLVPLDDVDGDGADDLLVGGDAAASEGLAEAGRAYVISGATRLPLDTLLSPVPTETGYFSSHMAALGDLDGDGVGDFVIGAEGDELDGGTNSGGAYVYSGATRALLYTLHSPEPTAFGAFGSDVAAAGDLTGDGVQEILVGALGERDLSGSGGFGSGQAHVFDGATGTHLRTILPPDGFDKGSTFAYFGRGVTRVGDLDDDGTRDHAIFTRYGNDGNGILELYSGTDGVRIGSLTREFTGESAEFGGTVQVTPDFDADGTPDLLVAAPSAELSSDFPPFEGKGVMYLYSGASLELIREFRPPSVTGPQPGGFGYAVAFAPDLDGDGLPELYVGAPGTDVATGGAEVPNAGRVYVVNLATGDVLGQFESPSPEFIGVFGFSLVTLDGDGSPTLFVGAPLENGRRGRIYVYDPVPVATEGDAEAAFTLHPVAPNPVAGRTSIGYELARPAHVRIDVYDMTGRRLSTLVDAAQPAGHQTVEWDTSTLPSGTYIYQMRAGAFSETLRATVVR